jgi:TrmH family RNA methyltransferase
MGCYLVRITSFQNSRIKNIVKLHTKKYRDQSQKMMIEGYYPILLATQNNYPLDELYFCPNLFFGKDEAALIRRVAHSGAKVIEVNEGPFRKMAYQKQPEGLLAVAPQAHHPLDRHRVAVSGLYIIAEALEKPANLGSILRSADAAGVNGVIVCDPCTDIFNPNVIRASTGTFFTIPILESSTEEVIAWCYKNNIRTLAATPQADILYTDVDMTGPIAIVVGAEQPGLSQSWLDKANLPIKLPMFGQANSLNVATAATALLYEAVRQRQAAGVNLRLRPG